jgi:RNA polymerase sigma factor (sigma-70 family)
MKVLRKFPTADYDNALSHAEVALWRCAKLFDPGRGLKFSTLAFQSCYREAYRRVKLDFYRKRTIHTESIHADAKKARPHDCRKDAPSIPSVLSQLIEEEDRQGWIKWMQDELAKLPENQRTAFWEYEVEGKTLRQVGKILGVCQERVRQLNTKTKAKLLERGQRRRRRLAAGKRPVKTFCKISE